MKARRQAKILELVRTTAIETQEELAEALAQHGIRATQATISRDIRELELGKVLTAEGRYRYIVSEEKQGPAAERRRRIFEESVLGFDYSENLIVIRTLPGTAASVAYAIDHWGWPEVLGTVAGEDTLFVVVKPKELVEEVLARLKGLMT